MKPMLAASLRADQGESLDSLSFPLIASPKIDGIRCLVDHANPLTRSLKIIPNHHIRKLLSHSLLNKLDGELLVGDGSNFQAVTSGIMSRDGQPDFTYHIFDHFGDPAAEYTQRLASLHAAFHNARALFPFLRLVPTQWITTAAELDAFTAQCIADGFEGAMVRKPSGPYKFGRATLTEGYLTKIKPMADAEGFVIGFEEQMTNTNTATLNELGRTTRSSHQAGMIGKDTLGTLIVENETFGEIRLSSGLDDALRREIWRNQRAHLGRIAKFRYQAIGTKDKPRIPTFAGFRHQDDIS